jgi:hypothetical protein
MDAVEFPQQTHVFAKNQPEYRPCPAHVTAEGEIISCWEPTDEDRARIAAGAKIWLRVLAPTGRLQPVHLETEDPWAG